MNKNITFKEKFQYYIENTISEGPKSVIKWLAITSLVSVLILGGVIIVFGISDSPDSVGGLGFIEGTWKSLMATLDPGTMGGDEGWAFRIVRFIATLIGIFLISILIGTISSGIDEKIETLKRGRSKVLEQNHTLILGWSEKIFSIISEIIIANENQIKPSIVILSEKDKIEAEEEIRAKISDSKNTKIIVRSGNPLDITDVSVANPYQARSIIVLSPNNVPNPDISVIKTVLGLTKNNNRDEDVPLNIVAEIRDEKNMEAAELVGNDETVFIQSSDIISKITAQTCLQSGLSVVYNELLKFDGDEIYFSEEKSLVGKTYFDAIFSYNDSSVIGVFSKEEEAIINPPMDYMIKEGEQIIAISEDDDTVVLNGIKGINQSPQNEGSYTELKSKITHTLILGWNERGSRIIQELNQYVSKGSQVLIVADTEESNAMDIEALKSAEDNLQITFKKGEICDKKTLESLCEEPFNNIILLSYKHLDIQESDAKTLICLLHLRNISKKMNKEFNIVSEMLDVKNRDLGVVAKADDFIVGDNLISLLLSQISENKELKKVYDELFKEDGSEIYLKPASLFVELDKEIDFYNVLANVAGKNGTAIGYRISKWKENSVQNFGVKLNPKKDEKIKFTAEDSIILLAEN